MVQYFERETQMSNLLTGLVVPIATYLGLKAAGSNPIVKAVGTGVALVKIIDGYAADSSEESVRKIYRKSDGSDPPIILLSEHDPAKPDFPGGSVTKDKLKSWVDSHGGTAWMQSGENTRIMYWWHPSKSFKPIDRATTFSNGLAVGHVVRGEKDAK